MARKQWRLKDGAPEHYVQGRGIIKGGDTFFYNGEALSKWCEEITAAEAKVVDSDQFLAGTVDEIVPEIAGAGDDELRAHLKAEKKGKGRVGVIGPIEAEIEARKEAAKEAAKDAAKADNF